jgi:hypothetical protein
MRRLFQHEATSVIIEDHPATSIRNHISHRKEKES